jgi:hypothetical protein
MDREVLRPQRADVVAVGEPDIAEGLIEPTGQSENRPSDLELWEWGVVDSNH